MDNKIIKQEPEIQKEIIKQPENDKEIKEQPEIEKEIIQQPEIETANKQEQNNNSSINENQPSLTEILELSNNSNNQFMEIKEKQVDELNKQLIEKGLNKKQIIEIYDYIFNELKLYDYDKEISEDEDEDEDEYESVNDKEFKREQLERQLKDYKNNLKYGGEKNEIIKKKYDIYKDDINNHIMDPDIYDDDTDYDIINDKVILQIQYDNNEKDGKNYKKGIGSFIIGINDNNEYIFLETDGNITNGKEKYNIKNIENDQNGSFKKIIFEKDIQNNLTSWWGGKTKGKTKKTKGKTKKTRRKTKKTKGKNKKTKGKTKK
jgi:hypothetical protein